LAVLFRMTRNAGSKGNYIQRESLKQIVRYLQNIMMLKQTFEQRGVTRDKFKHANCIIASIRPGIDQPLGSMIIANRAIPSESVLHEVAKTITSLSPNEFNLEQANFNDFASREVMPKLLRNI